LEHDGQAETGGGPHKYDAAVHRRIVDAIRVSVYRGVAFQGAGISRTTGSHWLRLAREQPEAYRDYDRLRLLRDVEQPRADDILAMAEAA
jgi:hypothetical protein